MTTVYRYVSVSEPSLSIIYMNGKTSHALANKQFSAVKCAFHKVQETRVIYTITIELLAVPQPCALFLPIHPCCYPANRLKSTHGSLPQLSVMRCASIDSASPHAVKQQAIDHPTAPIDTDNIKECCSHQSYFLHQFHRISSSNKGRSCCWNSLSCLSFSTDTNHACACLQAL